MTIIGSFGTHDTSRDFPIVDKTKLKYRYESSNEYLLGFPDNVTFQVPACIMHYLDDKESIGWEHNWLPPKAFIDRVMKGGEIKFGLTGFPPVKIGYLTYGDGENKGKIVDSHGGDSNIDNATLVEFGPHPEGFIERMRQIHTELQNCASKAFGSDSKKDDKKQDLIKFDPAKGYENIELTAPEMKMEYMELTTLVLTQAIKKHKSSGKPKDESMELIHGSHLVHKLVFHYQEGADEAIAKIEKSELGSIEYSMKEASKKSIFKKNPVINNDTVAASAQNLTVKFLKEMGIETGNIEAPYIKVSGDNFHKLKEMGADFRGLRKAPAIEDKFNILTGKRPDSVQIAPGRIVVDIDKRKEFDPSHFVIKILQSTGLESGKDFSWKNNVITNMGDAKDIGKIAVEGINERYDTLEADINKMLLKSRYAGENQKSASQTR